jgi:hypothetical protein
VLSGLALTGRLVLASVLAAAGAGKLLDREGSRAAVERFGVSTRLARPVGVALPILELALAATLIPVETAPWAALAAAGLLVVFSAAIARSIFRGDRHDCHCFGRLGSSHVGPAALTRNLGLATVAGLVAAASWGGDGPSALAWIGGLDPVGVAVLALGTAMALHVAFSWQLFQQNGRLLARVRALEQASADEGVRSAEPVGLPIGTPAPAFALTDLNGRRRTLDDLLEARRPVALVFSDPGCEACAALPLWLERAIEERTEPLEIALITRGDLGQNRTFLNGSHLEHVLLQEGREVLDAYRIRTLPSATVIDEHGRIAGSTASGDRAVEELLIPSADHPRDRLHAAIG